MWSGGGDGGGGAGREGDEVVKQIGVNRTYIFLLDYVVRRWTSAGVGLMDYAITNCSKQKKKNLASTYGVTKKNYANTKVI